MTRYEFTARRACRLLFTIDLFLEIFFSLCGGYSRFNLEVLLYLFALFNKVGILLNLRFLYIDFHF